MDKSPNKKDNDGFQVPRSKINISSAEDIPIGDFKDKLQITISDIDNKKSSTSKSPNKIVDTKEKKVFMSNNQKYSKKEEIEYGKKSHFEYVNAMKSNKDPLGVQSKGGLRPITMSEIKKHNTENSLWTVLNGNVYDLTMYLDYHPGGAKKLMMGAGKDCTFLFSKQLYFNVDKYHPWVNHNMLIGKLQIGYLAQNTEKDSDSDSDSI